ncbi:MAG: hypothetical protein HN742_39865 [Lentisphaerae bacterium]|jgi:hypothetical protein|nr:hypothetical protein [Lentisphaerota bacterium]MBT4821333.1 hypothetical protein [Lentisphaerota bacterium]MBT5611341.1 hypothetical protein [Lentisphaerota bacterium]MBT7058133.1 hypothetical protein [Lentisphaerota bacterium]MBT7848093.1 hypothetical protein [Lentisphaerota bacterium]
MSIPIDARDCPGSVRESDTAESTMSEPQDNTLPECTPTAKATDEVHGMTDKPSRRDVGLLVVALAAMASVAIVAGGKRTATIDEFHHLPAGCLTLKTGEFFMHPKSPPLARCWSALPAMVMKAEVPTEDVWRELAPGWGPWMYGTAFWMRNRKNYDSFFWWGRCLNMLWLVPLAFSLFCWAFHLYGRGAAWLTVLLMMTAPSLLAHAPLVTTDLAATSAWLSATFLAWKASTAERHQMVWGAGAGVALGIGMLAKFSLVLLPTAWLMIHALTTGAQLVRQRKTGGTDLIVGALWQRRLWRRRFVAGWALPMLVAMLLVNASYGFKGSFRPLSQSTCHSAVFARLANTPLGHIPVPLPRAYIDGLDAQKADSDAGEFPAYLAGNWSARGWWYYYLAVVVAKVPTAVLILLFWSLVSLRKRAGRETDSTWLWILVPPSMLLLVLMFGNDLDLGVRYVLPCLPFAWLLAGRVLASTSPGKPKRKALAGLVTWACASSLVACPDFLAYFSEPVGGWRHGHRWLLDSNLDWGQDLGRLGRYMTENEIPDVKLAYFGHVWPEHYGIAFTPLGDVPEPGHIAASVAYVMGQSYAITYAGTRISPVPQNEFGWLRQFEPVARIGRSIWLYNISESEARAARDQMGGTRTP